MFQLFMIIMCLTGVAGQLQAASQELFQVKPQYVAADDPSLHLVTPGGTLDGVSRVLINRTDGNFLGSGALLSSGMHVLTAAHLFTNGSGVYNTNSASFSFAGSGGTVVRNASTITVHPGWTGDLIVGNDLAVVTLDAPLPLDIDRYNIYTLTDEISKVAHKVGYGRAGFGATGDTMAAGILRDGYNAYDTDADAFYSHYGLSEGVDFAANSTLLYDFDNGLAANDFFDVHFTEPDLGLGDTLESKSAPGDSGGPSFIDGLIAGITSFGFKFNSSSPQSDTDGVLNSSFGEMAGDTRVSTFAGWITVQSRAPVMHMPEPGLYVALLGGLLLARRARTRAPVALHRSESGDS